MFLSKENLELIVESLHMAKDALSEVRDIFKSAGFLNTADQFQEKINGIECWIQKFI